MELSKGDVRGMFAIANEAWPEAEMRVGDDEICFFDDNHDVVLTRGTDGKWQAAIDLMGQDYTIATIDDAETIGLAFGRIIRAARIYYATKVGSLPEAGE